MGLAPIKGRFRYRQIAYEIIRACGHTCPFIAQDAPGTPSCFETIAARPPQHEGLGGVLIECGPARLSIRGGGSGSVLAIPAFTAN